MFYILCFLAYNDMIDTMPGADSLQVILYLGCIVVGLFSVVIISYTNSFIMKRRRRELGLYNILGMEKRHIARLLCCESVILGAGSILCGLALGILLSKLILLLLLKLLHFTVKMGFTISGAGILATSVLFAAIFVFILLKNLFHIRLSKPVELLHSDAVGEREPKTKWIVAILGVLTLGGGYLIANMVKSPLDALLLFFVAVILVIIGTYCLFTAGSIAHFEAASRHKHYYYKANHFTAVSGLLYRMKQNAVGLASICILSTMVLVTVSTTVCLYLGAEDALSLRCPTDITVMQNLNEEDNVITEEEALAQIKAIIEQSGRKITSVQAYNRLAFSAHLDENALVMNIDNGDSYSSDYHFLVFTTAESYHQLTGESTALAEDEVLCYSQGAELPNHFTLGDLQFTIKQRLEEPPVNGEESVYASNVQYLIVSNDTVLNEVFQSQKKAYDDYDYTSAIYYEMDFNLDGTDAEKLDCYKQLTDSSISGVFHSRPGYVRFLLFHLWRIPLPGTVLGTALSAGHSTHHLLQADL